MISQLVVVLWLVLSVGVIVWGLLSSRCSSAIRTCWKPAGPAEQCERVARALESGSMEQMLLALDRRCAPEQRSRLLKAILEEARNRRNESPEMKRLYTAIAHQCEKEAPMLAEFGLEDMLAELEDAESPDSADTPELAHGQKV